MFLRYDESKDIYKANGVIDMDNFSNAEEVTEDQWRQSYLLTMIHLKHSCFARHQIGCKTNVLSGEVREIYNFTRKHVAK